jgi:hypothetical protein
LHIAAASGNQDNDIFHGAHCTVPLRQPQLNKKADQAVGSVHPSGNAVYWNE